MKTLSVSLALAASAIGSGCALDGDTSDPGDETELTGTEEQAITSGERPLFVVLMRGPGQPAFAHDEELYRDALFGAHGGRNVRDYFTLSSRSKFSFREAGILTVNDDESSNAAAGVVSGDDSNTRKRKRARLYATRAGLDLKTFDNNHDGKISSDELTFLAIDNYSTASAQTGKPACTSVGGISVCSHVSLVGHQSQLVNFAHELSHTLSPETIDLYGASCLSQDITLMSCTAGVQGGELTNATTELDPYHRARLGWTRSVTKADATQAGGSVTVGLVHNIEGLNEVLQLTSGNETLTFEARGNSTYDDRTPPGLYAWYADLNSDGTPKDVDSLRGSTNKDKSVYLLQPVNDCVLDGSVAASRGGNVPLNGGTYAWVNRTTGRTEITVTPVVSSNKQFHYDIRWVPRTDSANRNCGQSAATPIVTAFKDINFTGASQRLRPGRFDVDNLSAVGNDAISSLQIPPDVVVTLCTDFHSMGACQNFTGQVSYVGDFMNDKASWIGITRLR